MRTLLLWLVSLLSLVYGVTKFSEGFISLSFTDKILSFSQSAASAKTKSPTSKLSEAKFYEDAGHDRNQSAGFDRGSKEEENDLPPPLYGRLVLLLVDALRADMVFGDSALIPHQVGPAGGHRRGLELQQYMPYTVGLLEEKRALGFVATAQNPTVTMPRLKALTSGRIPAFADIINNFNSETLEEENVLTNLVRSGHKAVLYGDDTWLKLFPDTFMRADGTSGFFTQDTEEVDHNVTRHLRQELDPEMRHPYSNDWDVLVLHYLGLDHVGHLRGPRSKLMSEKLGEMDDIVRTIAQNIEAQDKKRKSDRGEQYLPTLFLLISDHGMTDMGNHGGSATEEVSAVLVSIGSRSEQCGKEIKTTKQRVGADHSFPNVMQIDLVPTLASLFAVPTPGLSLGRVIEELIPREQKGTMWHCYTLYHNARQLGQLYKSASAQSASGEDRDVSEAYRAALSAWEQRQEELGMEKAIEKLSLFLSKAQKYMMERQTPFNEGIMLNGILGLGVASAAAFLLLLQVLKRERIEWSGDSLVRSSPFSICALFMSLGSIMYYVTLAGTSTIENEHATAFLLATTFIFFYLWHLGGRPAGTRTGKSHRQHVRAYFCGVGALLLFRLLRGRNQVINFSLLNGVQGSGDYSTSVLHSGPLFASPFSAMTAIGSLSVYKIIDLSSCKKDRGHSTITQVAVGASLLCTFLNLVLLWLRDSPDRTAKLPLSKTFLARMAFCLQGLLFFLPAAKFDVFRSKSPRHSSLAASNRSEAAILTFTLWQVAYWMLASLLQRPDNLPTLALLCFQSISLEKLFKSGGGEPTVGVPFSFLLIYLTWVGRSFFFSLGNSHVVSTIDISGAYTGLDAYDQAGILLRVTFRHFRSSDLVSIISLWIACTCQYWVLVILLP